MGILEYEIEEIRERRGQHDRDNRQREEDGKHGGQGNGGPNGGKNRKDKEETKKEPIGRREPVRLAGALVTLITAGALALFGYEVTAEQKVMLNDLLLLIIPVIVPVVAGFEVARSKVDSPATVERKMKGEGQR
jgi:hypothetical protein